MYLPIPDEIADVMYESFRDDFIRVTVIVRKICSSIDQRQSQHVRYVFSSYTTRSLYPNKQTQYQYIALFKKASKLFKF